MKENPVNGDRVKLTDPLDSENFLTLNELYMRLSKSTKLQYPAPFQDVDDLDDHVKIADELYLDEEEFQNYKDLLNNYTTLASQ